MSRLDDAFVSITVMNHPSTGNAYVYVHGRFAEALGVEPYTFDQPIPELTASSDVADWIRGALEAVIDAL